MEEENIVEKLNNNGENSKKREESTCELKQRLREQILRLKSIILQMEWSLDMLKFGNTKCVSSSKIKSDPNMQISDVNVQLEAELYRYSGLYCVKFSEEECIFNFSPSYKYDKRNIFAVQILSNQNKGTLGKWLMPMGIDLNDIVSECPLTDLKDTPNFLRTCKQYVNAYFVRQEQYTTLMNIISRTKYCDLQTNVGYTQIILELLGVHVKKTDSNINIIIYLFYNINAARPKKIKVESLTQDELDDNTRNLLEKSLMCFKKLQLQTAFEKMLNMKAFTWTKEDNDKDSPLEISNLKHSNDNEGYLNDFSLVHKLRKSRRSRTKVKKKQEVKNKNKFIDNSNTSEYNKQAISPNNEKQDLQILKEQSVSKQNIDIMDSTPNVNDYKRKKLKQIKLKFHLNDSESQISINATSSDDTAFKKKETSQQIDKPFTSTPVQQSEHLFNFIDDISDITVGQNNSDDGRKNNSKDQIQNHVSEKLLRKKRKSSTLSKAQSSKTLVHKRIRKLKK